MSYQSQVLSLSPLLYLPLTETTGVPGPGQFADASGHGHLGSLDHHTTPGGADSFLTGEKAAILQTNAIINFAAGSGFAPFTAFTVELWLQLQGSLNWFQDWLTLHLDDWPSSHTINLELDQRTGTNILTTIDNSYGVSDSALFPFTHVDCWHHYAVVYDSAAGQVRRYLDGALMSARSIAANPAFTTTEGYITAFNGPFNLAQLALYGAALTDEQIAANYRAATPRQDGACFVQWLRLRHASGRGYWQSTGEVIEEWAGGVKRLALPFATLDATPAVLMGQDPASDLPAFCPAPVIPPPLAQPPVPPPATPDICVQVRCGVALNCTQHLTSLYASWANWINGALSLIVGAITAAALAILLDPVMIELDIALWAFLRPVLVTLSSMVISAGMGPITSDRQTTLTQALFCQLACTGDVCTLDAATMVAWANALTAGGWSGFDTLESTVLNQLIRHTPMTDWQSAAANAGQSGACDAWTCP